MQNDSQKYIKLKKRAFFWAPICKYSLFVTIQPKNASQKPKRWYLRIQTFFLRFSSHSRCCNIAARGLLSFASEHRICNTFALKRFVYLRSLVSIPHESSAVTGDVYNSIEGWLNLTCFKLSQRLAGKRRE